MVGAPDSVGGVTGKGFALASGQSVDVSVQVTQSAQQGSLYLSLGALAAGGQAGTLDLNGAGQTSNSTFTIEVAGSLGSRLLSFSSGQTLTQIVDAINTFTDVTGVEATVNVGSGFGGVGLRSVGFGESEFVSVEVVSSGGLTSGFGSNDALGVYTLDDNNASFETGIDSSSGVVFEDGAVGIDAGQSVGGTINGVSAIGRGLDLISQFATPRGVLRVSLLAGSQFGVGAQQPGEILFSLMQSGPQPLLDGGGGGPPRPPLSTLDLRG